MVTCVLWMVLLNRRVEWKCAYKESGEQLLMISGMHLMPKWYAGSWDILIAVSMLSVSL